MYHIVGKFDEFSESSVTAKLKPVATINNPLVDPFIFPA